MRRVEIATIVAALLVPATSAAGAPAEDTLLTRSMRSQSGRVKVSVVDGRVRLHWTRLVQIRSSRNGDSVRETFQLRRDANRRLSLTYQRIAEDESLNLSITGEDVSIIRATRGQSSVVPVEYRQHPRGEITFSFGAGERKQTFSADDLWKLMLVRQRECKAHLVPLLEMMRPDWELVEMAAAIERELLDGADSKVNARRDRWAALVEQLADRRFAKREAADRALRAEGQAVIGYLRRLDFQRLDAEQRFRIRRIIEAVDEDVEDDSAEDVAARLAGDPAVWLALLGRTDVETRKTAARQLGQLWGGPIGVDPAADPDSQRHQRARLRARISR